MGGVAKMIVLSAAIHSEGTIDLIPLLVTIAVAVTSLVGVFLYGLRRVQRSEGLAPGRVEQPYAGPALSWTPTSVPARKLVTHDTLGLGSDMAWLNNRGAAPASPERQTYSYSAEPVAALELGAKVFESNLSLRAGNVAGGEKTGAQPTPAEKIAALRNAAPAPQPRTALTSRSGSRLRTAVLRAVDLRPGNAGTKRAEAEPEVSAK